MYSPYFRANTYLFTHLTSSNIFFMIYMELRSYPKGFKIIKASLKRPQ